MIGRCIAQLLGHDFTPMWDRSTSDGLRQLSEACVKAQNHALERYAKELELVFSLNPKFLHSIQLILGEDKKRITGEMSTTDKVRALIQFMVEYPTKYGKIMNIIKKNKNTKYIATIIEKTKVSQEKKISKSEKEDAILKVLANALNGKEILQKFNPDRDITAAIKDLVKSAQTAHPECEEFADMSMVELQEEVLKLRENNAELKEQLSKLTAEHDDTCRLNKEKDIEIDFMTSELVNQKNWTKGLETDIKILKDKVENLTQECSQSVNKGTMTDKETSEAKSATKISYQLPKHEKNHDHQQTINSPGHQDTDTECQPTTQVKDERSNKEEKETSSEVPKTIYTQSKHFEDHRQNESMIPKRENNEGETDKADSITIISSSSEPKDVGPFKTSRSASSISFRCSTRSSDRELHESNIHLQRGDNSKMVMTNQATVINCNYVNYYQCSKKCCQTNNKKS